MSWIESRYPKGSRIELPHPFTGEWQETTVTNHFTTQVPGPRTSIGGVVVQFPDGESMLVEAGFLSEDGNGTGREMTLEEAAQNYPLAYSTLAQYAREGKLDARRSGRTWLTTPHAIERLLK